MDWTEFCTLLAGIMYKTPLGQVVSVRSEEDENILKNFSQEQHRIRNEWRNKSQLQVFDKMTDEEKSAKEKEIQNIFKNMFA